jgi:hypothetical protein
VPVEADQVTAEFEVFITRAVNCRVPAETTVAVEGETVTVTAGGLFDDEPELAVETPEQAERQRSAAAKVIRITHCGKSARRERQLFLAGGSAGCDIQPPLERGFGRTLNR